MKVISIGSDRNLFHARSEVMKRAGAYAARFGELHIVVFSLRSHGLSALHHGNLHIYPTNSFSRLLYVFDAARIARDIPGDVVTVQDPFESGLAGIFGKKGRPLHVQLHTDMFSHEFARGTNRFRLLIAPHVLSRATRIRTLTQSLKEKIQAMYHPKAEISALPIFIDTQKFRNLSHKQHSRFKTVLLWVGRFEEEKNPELALLSFAEARKGHNNVGLIMLGNGSQEISLKRMAGKLKIEEWVEFPGWQEPANYLQEASLLLVTSKYEGYGRQIIEALASGVPVLSTNVGVAREAGAIVTSKKEFAPSLNEWIKKGPRIAKLAQYPYRSFEEYVEKYCSDIEAAVTRE